MAVPATRGDDQASRPKSIYAKEEHINFVINLVLGVAIVVFLTAIIIIAVIRGLPLPSWPSAGGGKDCRDAVQTVHVTQPAWFYAERDPVDGKTMDQRIDDIECLNPGKDVGELQNGEKLVLPFKYYRYQPANASAHGLKTERASKSPKDVPNYGLAFLIIGIAVSGIIIWVDKRLRK
jgi:hypothetical protein